GDFTANINWGDGTSSAGTISSQGNLFVIRGSQAYAEKGAYSISVAIQDDGAGVASAGTTSTATIADAPLTATAGPISATEGQELFLSAVATFSDGNPNASSSDFTAMVD